MNKPKKGAAKKATAKKQPAASAPKPKSEKLLERMMAAADKEAEAREESAARKRWLEENYPPIAVGISDLAKSDHRHSNKRYRFLAAYISSGGNISRAAHAAGVDRRSHYDWLTESEYAKAWKDAKRQSADVILDEIKRRAFEGYLKPITYKGEVTDYELAFETQAGIRILEAIHPDFQRKAPAVPKKDKGNEPIQEISKDKLLKLPEEQLLEVLNFLREARSYINGVLSQVTAEE